MASSLKKLKLFFENTEDYFTVSSTAILKYRNGETNVICNNRLYEFEASCTWQDVFADVTAHTDYYRCKSDVVTVTVSDKVNSCGHIFEPDIEEEIKVVRDFDKNLKFVKFLIERDIDPTETGAGNNSHLQEKNVFDVLMSTATSRKPPPLKEEAGERYTAKDRLFNMLSVELKEANAYFPVTLTDNNIMTDMMVPVNALWYLSGNMVKLQDRGKHRAAVKEFPERFLKYDGFNDWRKKKHKRPSLSAADLRRHSQCVFSLLSKPYTATWGPLRKDFELLAISMSSYADFLVQENDKQQKRQLELHPARQIETHIWLEFRAKSNETNQERYFKLNSALADMDIFQPLYLDPTVYIPPTPNSSLSDTAYRYLRNLSINYNICLLRYDPGGSIGSVIYVWKVPEDTSSTSDMLTANSRMIERLKPNLPLFHTRQMKRNFYKSYSYLGGVRIPPYILRNIYSDLTQDASADQNPAIDSRVRLAVLGDIPDLVIDMRHLNKGRPDTTFEKFFSTLEHEIDSLTAADERRHNVEHISRYISIRDLIEQTKEKLDANVPIPSEATVLLAFVPKNAHYNVSKLYKGRVPLRMKVQTRQLRASHVDDHYCAAVFKYMREYAIKYRDKSAFVCLDDKSKVDYGEPGMHVSSGVRGKQSIVPMNSALSCLDHDVNSKGSLTPSVCLDVDLPDDISSGSFYRGNVTVTLKDSIFQPSSPFRHMVELQHILELREKGVPPLLFIFTDGGPDHRLTYHAVKLSLIILFKRLGLELLVAGRTAPGHSWANPAERIMSLINLAFQNTALARDEMNSHLEQIVKSCGSMSEIRSKANKNPDLVDGWMKSVASIKDVLEARLKRVNLKEKPFQILAAATSEDVSRAESVGVSSIDNSIKTGEYQNAKLTKAVAYKEFLANHCLERHYLFQIRRCKNEQCCRQDGEDRMWVPDPMLQDKDHYKPFDVALGSQTSEKDRPSSQKETIVEVAEHQQGCKNNILVAQNVRHLVHCFDCRKPRCIYSKTKLTQREQRSLKHLLEKHDYSCGSILTPDGDALQGKVFVRLQMDCHTPIEFPFYASGVGRPDLCCHCASENSEKDPELLTKYKVVLPVCDRCRQKGFEILKRNPLRK